jgi:geranylgeranyl diphosphate synthase, type II
MHATTRIEKALTTAVAIAGSDGAPPGLAAAIRHAVFPGGARLRPRLCLAVAAACGEDAPRITDAAAAAIELLHCASLVHDDLPCFDDAPVRRGKPSVHRAFGEPLAVLTGDALIVLAFETLARGAGGVPQRLVALMLTVGHSVGMPSGIVAGQAWESEPGAVLADYQRAKTGALFAAATGAGAAAVGADPGSWRLLGERLGEAYQVVDDIRDVAADAAELGKPTGRDAALGRPNAAIQLGIEGAMARLERLVDEAVAAIPPCPGDRALRALVRAEAQRFLPEDLSLRAA